MQITNIKFRWTTISSQYWYTLCIYIVL